MLKLKMHEGALNRAAEIFTSPDYPKQTPIYMSAKTIPKRIPNERYCRFTMQNIVSKTKPIAVLATDFETLQYGLYNAMQDNVIRWYPNFEDKEWVDNFLKILMDENYHAVICEANLVLPKGIPTQIHQRVVFFRMIDNPTTYQCLKETIKTARYSTRYLFEENDTFTEFQIGEAFLSKDALKANIIKAFKKITRPIITYRRTLQIVQVKDGSENDSAITAVTVFQC